MAVPQQQPLEAVQTKKVRPEWRAFIVREEEGKDVFITLASFFRNKNNKLSGKATLRFKAGEGDYQERESIVLKNGEFINLSVVE